MSEIFNIKLDKSSDIPLYRQLSDKILELIECRTLKPTEKLPPVRKLSEELGVSLVTAINAYKFLENKKILYSQVGSGTYVSSITINDLPEPIPKAGFQIHETVEFNFKNAINFAKSSPNANLFPVDEFKLIFNNVLERDKGDAFSYQDAQGYPPLREALVSYLLDFGIKTSEERIQVISGAQQGIDILSKAMLSSNDVVFVEKPTFYGAIGAFLSRNAQVIEIELESDGMNVEKLESYLRIYNPKFIYLMPYYQTPTCISYSIKKKNKILALAQKYNTYIIEEDNQCEFTYSNEKIIPLKALDYKNRVIYIKSFSKILMPGLRLGFMVLPKKIIENVTNAKYVTDISTSGFIQRAFTEYLQGNDFKKHVSKMKEIYKNRYEATIRVIDKYLLQYVDYKKPDGGVNLWLSFKKNVDVNKICEELLFHRIIVTPGDIFSKDDHSFNSIKISFADLECKDIEIGIQKIGEYLCTVM